MSEKEEQQQTKDENLAEFKEKHEVMIKIANALVPNLENPDRRDDKQQLLDKEILLSLLNYFTEFNLTMPDILATHISKSIKDGTITYQNIKYVER